MLSNGFKGGNFLANGIAILSDKTITNNSKVNITINGTTDGSYQNGFIVFDYISPDEFKYV
jgi:hypothetical protein